MTEYDSVSDVEVRQEHIDFLREAGASPEFLALLKLETGDVRHSVEEEIMSYIYYNELRDPETFSPHGGGFFMRIWHGQLFMAFLHADPVNKGHMLKVFSLEQIQENGVQIGEPLEYVEQITTEAALSAV